MIHYRNCNLCEAMCGLEIEHNGQNASFIRGDKQDPFSRGHLCPKAWGLKDIHEDSDRLRMPIKRVGQSWQEISWEEAFEEAADRLVSLQKKYDNSNVLGIYLGNPNVHNTGSMLYNTGLIRSLKTKNRFSATSVDQLPHHFASYYMFGHQAMIPIPDIDRTDYLLIMGANPLASNGSLMTAPDIGKRLDAIRNRGGKVVLLDPRRTETAAKSSEHHFIRPGSDALFLAALIQEIWQSGKQKPDRLEKFTEGWETLKSWLEAFTPEYAARACGISAEAIRTIAQEFAEAPRAVAYGRMGLSTQPFGGLCQWLINVLNILTGNLDRQGGAMFTLPAIDVVGLSATRGGSHGRWKSRVRGLPEFGGELPVSTLIEEIMEPGEEQIRGMVTVAGNPVLSTPNGQKLEEALSSLEFMLSIDIYLNETTRHADIILPPQTGLEKLHYDLVFHYLAIRNTAKFSTPLFQPAPNTRADWQIARELKNRIHAKKGNTTEAKSKDPFERLSPEALLDLALRYGPYGSKGRKFYPFHQPEEGIPPLTLQVLREHPHGIDLGPLKPVLPHRLFTQNRKIQLSPEVFGQDLLRLKDHFQKADAIQTNGFDLRLIGRRHLLTNNSWMHNVPRLVRGRNRCTLMMNPEDISLRNLVPGQSVQVSSAKGSLEIELESSEALMKGVVSIPHGWGHNRPGIRLQTAQEVAGVSINDLSDPEWLDTLTGNAALNDIPVKVEAIL